MDTLRNLFLARQAQGRDPSGRQITGNILSGLADAGLLSSGYKPHFQNDMTDAYKTNDAQIIDKAKLAKDQEDQDALNAFRTNQDTRAQSQEDRDAEKYIQTNKESGAQTDFLSKKYPELKDSGLSGQDAMDYVKLMEDQKLKSYLQNVNQNYKQEYLNYLKNRKSGNPTTQLAPDDRAVVSTLGGQIGKKESIKNQIDGYLAQWDQTTDEKAKLDIGRKLLKIVNSTEGADAIGSEEAKRLGAKLEYATGNFFNSNPTQFGRDLEGFRKDTGTSSRAIGDAVKSNQAEIDRRLGRTGSKKQIVKTQANPKTGQKRVVYEDGSMEIIP